MSEPSLFLPEKTGEAIKANLMALSSLPGPKPSPEAPITFLEVCPNERLFPNLSHLFPVSPLILTWYFLKFCPLKIPSWSW